MVIFYPTWHINLMDPAELRMRNCQKMRNSDGKRWWTCLGDRVTLCFVSCGTMAGQPARLAVQSSPISGREAMSLLI